MSLFPSTQTAYRLSGSFVRGEWVEGSQTEFTFQGSIQPATGKDLELLPQGLEDRGMVKIYTNSELTISREDTSVPGDIVIWQGGKWQVIAQLPNQSNIIFHFKYMAAYRGTV